MKHGKWSIGARAAILVAAGASAAAAVAITVPTMTAGASTPPAKVTLCHRTDAENNPYVQITVAVPGAYHHYSEHQGSVWTKNHPKEPKWGDIIPPFTYRGKTYSLNYGDRGQVIYANGCQTGSPTPSSTPPSSSSTS